MRISYDIIKRCYKFSVGNALSFYTITLFRSRWYMWDKKYVMTYNYKTVPNDREETTYPHDGFHQDIKELSEYFGSTRRERIR